MCSCEQVLRSDEQLGRKVKAAKDAQLQVKYTDKQGEEHAFGLVAAFYKALNKKEIILHCTKCHKRWAVSFGLGPTTQLEVHVA